VTLSDNLTSIGKYAFTGCIALPSIIIPPNVISIDEYAFWCCYGLTSVTISNGVTTIGSLAFANCEALTSVTIPSSVNSIGNAAFGVCSSLTSIKVESGNSKYDSRNDCNAIIESASNTLLFGCMNTVIPDGITSIFANAFNSCYGLTSITIPNSVTFIDYDVFYDCIALTDVYCYAEKVPETSNFLGYPYGITIFEYNATLHVPAGSIDAYKAAVPWSYFKNIVAIDATGIKSLDGTVVEPFDVYDLSGHKVLSHVTSLEGLPSDIYIVNGKKILKQ
jgi:hypothetical protein